MNMEQFTAQLTKLSLSAFEAGWLAHKNESSEGLARAKLAFQKSMEEKK